jgi:hypothetical protein
MSTWRTNVTELIVIFHDSLVALVPQMDRARIEWRNESAYDDWDAIAQTLFAHIVVASLRWALPEEKSVLNVPEYNTTYDQYIGKAIIVVEQDTHARPLVFHSFETAHEPFDTVRAVEIDDNQGVVSDRFVMLRWGSATFSVRTEKMTFGELTVDV